MSPLAKILLVFFCSKIQCLNDSCFQLTLSGTFDVQSVDITRVSDLEGFINITCHFAQGSLIKGCKIIISRTAGDKICEYIATREEGSSEALIQVILPAGHYRVEVYDDEDVAVKNAAYNTTLMFFKSSPMQNSAAGI